MPRHSDSSTEPVHLHSTPACLYTGTSKVMKMLSSAAKSLHFACRRRNIYIITIFAGLSTRSGVSFRSILYFFKYIPEVVVLDDAFTSPQTLLGNAKQASSGNFPRNLQLALLLFTRMPSSLQGSRPCKRAHGSKYGRYRTYGGRRVVYHRFYTLNTRE